MKIVSDEYKVISESLDGDARYIERITLDDGTVLTDKVEELKYSNMCNNSTNFSFGNTASAILEFQIDMPTVELQDKEIVVEQGLELADGTIEYIKLGKFKVDSAETEAFRTSYRCVDAMTYKMSTKYESQLAYPVTDLDVLEEVCAQTGISLVNSDLTSHTVSKKLENYTKREIIGIIAQLQGKNAIINADGNLELVWYENADYVIDDSRIYSDRTDIIKSEINYSLGYIVSNYGSTSIRVGDGETGATISNPYMTQEILEEVFAKIGGFTFTTAEVDFYGDFRLEVGDIVSLQTDGITYVLPVMTLEHNSDGGVVTTVGSVGETATQNSVDTNGKTLNELKRSVVNSETARSIAEQSADKINFIVEGDSVSEFTISDKALDIISENIDLTGKVTFNSFDKETQETLSNISEPIKEAEGSPILLTDSAESNLIDFKAYGRSTQDGTPTPDAPIDIVSVGEGGTLDIKSTSRNLIPYPYFETSHTENGVTFTVNEDGSVRIKGTPTATANLRMCWGNEKLSLPVGTYIISGCNSADFRVLADWYDATNTILTQAGNTSSRPLFEVTEENVANGHKLGVSLRTYANGNEIDVVVYPMIRGAEITDDNYEPYISSSISIPLTEPLRSIGDVKDEIACVDGVYGVIRRIASEVFKGDSSERWYKHSTLNNVYYRNFANAKGGNNSSLWSHFINNDDGVNKQGEKWDNPNNGTKCVCLEVDTLDEWLAWLQSNNITVQYILAEEVFEPFADQTPFYNIATFDSVTYITATDNAEMKVEYFRNTSTGQQLSNANSNANDAINKANEAITQVNKTVKSITMHYLATTASSGVTTSTSGWTTTVQQIDATKKYLWTYQTINYVDNTTTDTNPVISGVYGNKGKDGEDGTNGVGITSVVPLYYLKSNTTAPSAPTSAVTSTAVSSGVWTKSVPTYVANYTYFTCTQTQYTNGTYGWSTVVADNALTNANKNATNANKNATNALNKANSVDDTLSSLCVLENNITVIDGSKIYTGSVTADKIDVNDLFAQTITATGTITGAKLYGTYIESVSGKIGGFTIKSNALYNRTESITSKEHGIYVGTNGIRTVGKDGEVTHTGYYSKYSNRPENNVGAETLIMPTGVRINNYTYGGYELDTGLMFYKDGEHIGEISDNGFIVDGSPALDFEGNGRLKDLNLRGTLFVNGETTLNNKVFVSAPSWNPLEIKRTGSSGNVAIKFEDDRGILGYLTIIAPDGKLRRMLGSDTNKVYDLMDSSGGTFSGNVGIGGTSEALWTSLFIQNSLRRLQFAINTSGQGGIYDDTNSKWLLISDADGSVTLPDLKKDADAHVVCASSTGKLVVSTTTSGALYYIKNLTGDVQKQLNNRLTLSGGGKVNAPVSTQTLTPTANSTSGTTGHTLGTPQYKWRYLYAYSSSIQTSDKRYKTNINYIEDNEVLSKFFDALKPCTYFMVGGDRKHIGLLAQDALKAMQDNGMTIDDLSFVCKDQEYKLIDENKPNTEENREYLYDENGEPLYIYGLKYTELHGLEINEIQKLKKKVSTLEDALEKALARIEALEEKINQ